MRMIRGMLAMRSDNPRHSQHADLMSTADARAHVALRPGWLGRTDCHTLGVDGTEVAVLKKMHKEVLSGLQRCTISHLVSRLPRAPCSQQYKGTSSNKHVLASCMARRPSAVHRNGSGASSFVISRTCISAVVSASAGSTHGVETVTQGAPAWQRVACG